MVKSGIVGAEIVLDAEVGWIGEFKCVQKVGRKTT